MLFCTQIRRSLLPWLASAFDRFVKTDDEKGHLEVERKFKLGHAEASALPARLAAHGFAPTGVLTMTDFFLPCLVRGEMLRVRREVLNAERAHYLLTYKRWVETGD